MRDLRRRLMNGALAAICLTAIACAVAPTDAGLTGDLEVALAKGDTPVTATVVSTSPGLNPTPDNTYSVTIPSGGYLDIRPSCSSADRLNLQGMTAAFDALGTRSTCNGSGGAGYMFLKPRASHTSAAGACPDQDAPQQTVNGWNFGVTSRYFFQVDGSDADLKFDDTQYTLVLTDCNVEVIGTARRVTAHVGNLYAGQTGTPIMTGVAVNVDVTIVP